MNEVCCQCNEKDVIDRFVTPLLSGVLSYALRRQDGMLIFIIKDKVITRNDWIRDSSEKF